MLSWEGMQAIRRADEHLGPVGVTRGLGLVAQNEKNLPAPVSTWESQKELRQTMVV